MDTCFVLPFLWVLGASLISALIGWLWAKRGASDHGAQRNMELENLKISSSNDLAKLQNKFDVADRDRAKADAALESLREKHIQLQNTKAVVKEGGQVSILNKSIKTLEDKLSLSNKENDKLTKELKAQPKQTAKSESILKSQIDQLTKNNNKLSNALEQKESIIAKSVDTHKAKTSALSKNISTLKSEIKSLNKKAPKPNTSKLSGLENKLKRVTLANGTLSNALKTKERELKNAKLGTGKLNKMSNEVLKLKKQLKDREEKIKSQSGKSKALNSKVKTASKKQESKFKDDLKKAKKAIKKLKKELAQGPREIEVTRSIDMAELKKMLDNDKLTKTTKKVLKKKK